MAVVILEKTSSTHFEFEQFNIVDDAVESAKGAWSYLTENEKEDADYIVGIVEDADVIAYDEETGEVSEYGNISRIVWRNGAYDKVFGVEFKGGESITGRGAVDYMVVPELALYAEVPAVDEDDLDGRMGNYDLLMESIIEQFKAKGLLASLSFYYGEVY